MYLHILFSYITPYGGFDNIIVFHTLILTRSIIRFHILGPVGISAATDVDVSTEVDKRPGFFGHAILTITWQHPLGDVTTPHTHVL